MVKNVRSLTLAVRNWLQRNTEAVRLRQECAAYDEILAELTSAKTVVPPAADSKGPNLDEATQMLKRCQIRLQLETNLQSLSDGAKARN